MALENGKIFVMKVHVEGRSTGVVRLLSSKYRTLTGGHFHAERKKRVEIPLLLEEDVHVVQAATEPLRFLFPSFEWEEWGIEILEGHTCIAEVLIEERTLLVERCAIDHFSLLSWELFASFLQAVCLLEFQAYITEEDAALLARVAQLFWFSQEGEEFQYDILSFLAESSNVSPQPELQKLLWGILPAERRYELFDAMQKTMPSTWEVEAWIEDNPYAKQDLWLCAKAYNSEIALCAEERELDASYVHEHLSAFKRAFSVCSLLSWEAICSILPGMLARFFFEVKPSANSTDRRLGLFRVVVEQCLRAPSLLVSPFSWPQMSLLALDPERHPKIYQTLLQFLELVSERDTSVFWPIASDETMLAQLALQNQLSEQDDRFFRQATHIQAIWRDILHRSASQEWASLLLFDTLERIVVEIESDPDLLFAAVIWNRAMWENAPTPIAPALQNLREGLWVLSQAPLAVLRRLYPEGEEQTAEAHKRWPLFRTHLKRFFHLAPPILSRLCEQLEEEQGKPNKNESGQHPFEIDADSDIPQQELHGRILPLLSRPDIERYQRIDIERTKTLRVLHLDRYLHQSSGLWKEHRFFSSFLLFFKTSHNEEEGGWSELALWIDKDLDLGKVVNRKVMSSTIRGLLLEDGIWERTYRYQFLTVEQLMEKLNPNVTEWKQLLQLLGSEYVGLIEKRLREVLDFQYYMMRSIVLDEHALTRQLYEPNMHPLWCLPVEEFEAIKEALVGRMAARILRAFYQLQLQDDRSWAHAHRIITQRVQDISELLTLAPGDFAILRDDASDLHRWCVEILDQWVEQPDSFASLPQDAETWMKNKVALLQRLERHHRIGALEFVHFLLGQFIQPLRVVELLMEQPLEEEGEKVFFKPIPTSTESAERQKELVPFLRNDEGQLISPAFLELFCHIPQVLLHDAIQKEPSLLPALRNVARLLRSLDHNNNQTHLLWETIEELQTLQSDQHETDVPTHQAEDLPLPMNGPKGSMDA